MVSTSDCYAEGLESGILPLLKYTCWEATGYHAGHQEISRCHTRGKSQEYIAHMPPSSANKAGHSGFETQRRHHQKSIAGVSVASQKGLISSKTLKKKTNINFICLQCVVSLINSLLLLVIIIQHVVKTGLITEIFIPIYQSLFLKFT